MGSFTGDPLPLSCELRLENTPSVGMITGFSGQPKLGGEPEAEEAINSQRHRQ